MKRILIDELANHVNKKVELYGWIYGRRDLGKLTFLDLKDSTGIVQLVIGNATHDFHVDNIIKVTGTVKPRQLKKADDFTVPLEIAVDAIIPLTDTKPAVIPTNTDGHEIEMKLRLEYRYLDLRRIRLLKNLIYRDKVSALVREFLHQHKFLEVETPLLTEATPEGARDFIVPSRLQKGKYYALPQSPQQYKELLVMAGIDRYFQLARCLRDEDLRADRSFEHTQIDIEMAFVEQEEIMNLTEDLVLFLCDALDQKVLTRPFPRIQYKEALKIHGSDKFDLRNEDEKDGGVLSFAWVTDFPLFEKIGEGKWTYAHNPFSKPREEDIPKVLKGEREGVTSTQYDLICNGVEVGGGSLRCENPNLLSKILRLIGFSPEQIEDNFGHFLKALSFGTPPHGGLALGLERLLMLFLKEEAISEVTAFPMSYTGRTAVMNAPKEINPEVLKEYGL